MVASYHQRHGTEQELLLDAILPPKPHFTDNDIPKSLSGKVYVVTGANCGTGKELARVLYSKGAKVYITCRTPEKSQEAMTDIRGGAGPAEQKSGGELVPLQMDLADLPTVRSAAQAFLASESQLHGLFNNAGVMVGDHSGNTAQGHEEALGVNCIGPFLFTQLLTPALATAAKAQSAGTVRVVWVSGFGLEQCAPEGRGVDLDNLDYHDPKPGIERYGISKAGVWLLAVEYSRRHHAADGIVSVAINPGNVRTELARHQGIALKLIAGAIVYPIIRGVYTQLFAVFSNDISTRFDYTKEWVIPFGRIAPLRPDLIKATRPTEEGGNGNAQQFWEWNKDKVQEYMK
ncbi:estradiol 17 beta-dehydrogenase [Apiospora hydei]|uniref:Estradiol 17 beta-dehydrogenase n=1 Tax=Apiospora hydei TaxID=1337664 RepID=A0ABR1V7P9_9PEZI